MPIGALSVTSLVIDDLYRELAEKKLVNSRECHILDCGIGYGIYGPMIRQWLDQGYVKNFRTNLMGIEGFSGYRNPCWEAYDVVHVMKIEDYFNWNVAFHDKFNAILIMDVIEHFDHVTGLAVLDELKRRLKPGGVLYCATPGIMNAQGPVYGNELEVHKHEWSAIDFINLGFTIKCDGINPDFLGNLMILAKYVKGKDK